MRPPSANDIAWALINAARETGEIEAVRRDPRNALYYARNCWRSAAIAYRALVIAFGEARVMPVASCWPARCLDGDDRMLAEDIASWLARPKLDLGPLSTWADHAADAFIYGLGATWWGLDRAKPVSISDQWFLPGEVIYGHPPGYRA